MNIGEIKLLMNEIRFPEYTIDVSMDSRGEIVLQASYIEADTATGLPALQFTRKWLLSPEMTKSEVVQTAFKCILTSMEHKTREWFTYRGKAIFGPHYNVDALLEICGKQGSHDAR